MEQPHSPLDVAVRGKQDPRSGKQLKGFGFVFLLKPGEDHREEACSEHFRHINFFPSNASFIYWYKMLWEILIHDSDGLNNLFLFDALICINLKSSNWKCPHKP